MMLSTVLILMQGAREHFLPLPTVVGKPVLNIQKSCSKQLVFNVEFEERQATRHWRRLNSVPFFLSPRLSKTKEVCIWESETEESWRWKVNTKLLWTLSSDPPNWTCDISLEVNTNLWVVGRATQYTHKNLYVDDGLYLTLNVSRRALRGTDVLYRGPKHTTPPPNCLRSRNKPWEFDTPSKCKFEPTFQKISKR